MKLLRNLLPIAAVAMGLASSAAYADCSVESFNFANRQRDFEAVQEFVNSKRTIGLGEKECNLTISGDVRFDWAHINERVHCHKLRADALRGKARQIDRYVVDDAIVDTNGGGLPFSEDVFAVEFNLYFDYVCDRAWAVAWLQFRECGGIEGDRKPCFVNPEGLFGSGSCERLCLRKAYVGYNVCADGCARFDVELGRRPLYTVFDSRVQFQERFDGLLLKYARDFECWGDFYWNLGAFVVDERVDHYAWVTEVGLLNVGDWGLDLKYSYIDWKSLLKDDTNRCGTRDPLGANFRVNQITFAYNFNPEYLCVPAKVYGAFLWNSAAKKFNLADFTGNLNDYRNSGKQNTAWYLGFIIGEVCREGDWSFDCNYQVVDMQAIPNSDVSGIGSSGSNLLGRTPYSVDFGSGFTNYRGWRFEGLYALTDNLSLDAILEFLQQKEARIGGHHSYSKFELQAIYAF